MIYVISLLIKKYLLLHFYTLIIKLRFPFSYPFYKAADLFVLLQPLNGIVVFFEFQFGEHRVYFIVTYLVQHYSFGAFAALAQRQ